MAGIGANERRRVAWYWHRLRAMSGDEVWTRLLLVARKALWRRRQAWPAPRPALPARDPWSLDLAEVDPDERQALLAEADAYLAGGYELLGAVFPGPSPDWHLDPHSGVRAPLVFGLDIDYRDRAVAGDVKVIWELNRHHHLTVLALAYALTREPRYAEAVGMQLVDWCQANPFPRGINWHSSLELGVRLIAWVWIERLLRGSPAHQVLFGPAGVLWPAIYRHQWLINRHRSRGSSANNHLVGELAGLFVAATVWPGYPESAGWQATARAGLEREIARQTYASGLNREQAFGYHLFALELFLLPALEAARCGAPFSSGYHDWLTRMLEVVPLVTDAGGNLPNYGDADDGLGVQLAPRGGSRLAALNRVGRQWLGARVPAVERVPLAAAVLQPPGGGAPSDTPALPQGSLALADAGLYLLTSARGSADEMYCLADAGPLGYGSLAAHGHADALAFTLSVGGRPVIVDPGTYSYFRDPHWRKYFRSSAAHNTVSVDAQDQSEAQGPFLWGRKARCTVLEWTPGVTGAVLHARHDGYRRLPGRVVHERRLALQETRLDIEDRIAGGGRHGIEWRLHFHPDCTVALEPGRCLVSWQGGELHLALDPQLEWAIARGERHGGWYSEDFNHKRPCATLIGRCHATLPLVLHHRMQVWRAAAGAKTAHRAAVGI